MQYNVISMNFKMFLDYKLAVKLVREAGRKCACAHAYKKKNGNTKKKIHNISSRPLHFTEGKLK